MDPCQLSALSYVDFVAVLGETNRPPGGKATIRRLLQNAFIDRSSHVLEIGCHTGFTSLEMHRVAGCRVIGIDQSLRPLEVARQRRLATDAVSFVAGDAHHLPFRDAYFDAVVCGGSTAWVRDRDAAIQEYIRVTKPWGRIAAIPFFYRDEPPAELLDELKSLLGVSITNWGLHYWKNLFTARGLELYYAEEYQATVASDTAVDEYVRWLANRRFPVESERELYEVAVARLDGLFRCFNRNNQYLSYALLVFRVRPDAEERTLFD